MLEKSKNIAGMVEGLTFRKKNKREADSTRIAEITVAMAMDYDLAKDVLPEMASDLFISRAKPKTDLREAVFNIPSKTYLMTVRETAAARQQKIPGCTIRAVVAYKADVSRDSDWLLGFTVAFIMLSPDEMTGFLKRLFSTMYFTFEEQEPAIEFDGGEDEQGAETKVNKRGEVESIADRKKPS